LEGSSFQPDTLQHGAWNGIDFINTSALNQASIFEYCIFEYSKSISINNLGGVIYCYNFSNLKITNSVFRNNFAVFGSVIGCDYYSCPQLTGNLFHYNSALLAGSPFYFKYSQPFLNNNTIADNEIMNEDEWYQTAFVHNYISKPELTGNIIRNNHTNFYFQYQILEGKSYYITYNNIENGYEGTGNIDLPAGFINTGNHPYSLSANSACINSGNIDLPFSCEFPVLDLAGDQRIHGDTVDLGAYEWQGTSVDDDIIPENEFNLTNYPNPFNPSTVISFKISDIRDQGIDESGADVELTIYNLKGQKIKQYSIINNQSSVVWDGTDSSGKAVTSGIYFSKIQLGKLTASRKMILLK